MKAIVFISLFFITLCASAQRELDSINQTKEGEVYYLGKNRFARITVSTELNIRLYFKSMNTLQTPAKIDTVGGKAYYHVDLDAKNYSKTNLEIIANGFSPLNISWNNLQPNQWLRYYIYDPDSTLVDCYNQLTREGMKLFQAGDYGEAKRKYEETKTCSTLFDEGLKYVDNRLQLIDTLILWRTMANEYFTNTDYIKAIAYYGKILEINPSDQSVRNKSSDAQRQLSENCKTNFDQATRYFNDKDWLNAQIQYQKVVDQQCPNFMAEAKNQLGIIKDKLRNKCSNVLTYEDAKDVPVGFSIGSYKDHKVSGYFTLRLNSDVFEAIRTNTDSTKRPELNLSFGWSIPIVKPVWLFFGPGYTGVGQYVASSSDGQNATPENLDLKINSAISPEIGLLGKIVLGKVGIALRYTFQYRFALDKEMQDYVGQTRHVFGIGLCF